MEIVHYLRERRKRKGRNALSVETQYTRTQRLAAIEKMRINQTKSKTIIFIKQKNNIPAQFTWFSKIPVGNLWKL